jgi:pimeloyl-ACP methyl ester carboxylesterase
MTWSERTVVRDGVRISCRDWGGAGPPVVLLHGLAGHAGEWDTTSQRLRARHRVVAVDQRGHGASERHPRDRSRAAYIADVVAVLDQLELHQPVLVGQSLGGHTAMLTATAHPELVRALVLVEAGPGGSSPEAVAEIGAWFDSWPTPFPSLEAAVKFLGGGPVGEGWASGLEERDDGWWPRFDREVMVDSLSENARRAYWEEWTGIACLTLVVLGQSGIITPDESGRMLQQRPETAALSIPGTGHDLHLEQPDTLLEALGWFLHGLTEPPARKRICPGMRGRHVEVSSNDRFSTPLASTSPTTVCRWSQVPYQHPHLLGGSMITDEDSGHARKPCLSQPTAERGHLVWRDNDACRPPSPGCRQTRPAPACQPDRADRPVREGLTQLLVTMTTPTKHRSRQQHQHRQ